MWLRQRRIPDPPDLLIHRQEIETVPPFDDSSITHDAHRDPGELDRVARGRPAEGVTHMPALHAAIRRACVPFGDYSFDRDLEIPERVPEDTKHSLELGRAAHRRRAWAAKTVRDQIRCRELVDGLFASLIPHFLEPLPNDRIRCLCHGTSFAGALYLLLRQEERQVRSGESAQASRQGHA